MSVLNTGGNTNIGVTPPQVVDEVDDLLGRGGSTGGGSTGGGGGGSAGGGSSGGGGATLVNLGGSDNLVRLALLSDDAIARLTLLDHDEDGDGFISLSVLDQNRDGLVEVSLFDSTLNFGLLDADGDGLIKLALVDLVDVGGGGGEMPGGSNPGPVGSTDSEDYQVVLRGTLNRDMFRVDTETTYVDGMDGLDVSVFAGSFTAYQFNVQSQGVFVSTASRTNYLIDVERLAFTDGTVVLDTGLGESGGMAYRIYQAAFDRTPDNDGLAFWLDKVDAGMSMNTVAESFLGSREFQSTYGNLSNLEFIQTLYQNILQRDGEAAGIDYWSKTLDAGAASRAEVLVGFSESTENVGLVATVIANGYVLT